MNSPGWYGKLPSLGDFASRRLPQEFVTEWDAWLQQGVAQSKEHLGSRWLEIYLTSNIWRFLLAPNALMPGMWGGIVLPSVDRVGRYFPLTLCADLGCDGNIIGESLESWYLALEETSRLGLDAQTSLEQFDQALQRVVFLPKPAAPGDASAALTQSLLNQASFTHFEAVATHTGALIESLQNELFRSHITGYSIWSCVNPNSTTGGFICKGMPSPGVYARMLEYTPGSTS